MMTRHPHPADQARDRRRQIRAEVIGKIIVTMIEADAAGREPCSAARRAFPRVPERIISEAFDEFHLDADALWRSPIRTVDHDVLVSAIANAGARVAR